MNLHFGAKTCVNTITVTSLFAHQTFQSFVAQTNSNNINSYPPKVIAPAEPRTTVSCDLTASNPPLPSPNHILIMVSNKMEEVSRMRNSVMLETILYTDASLGQWRTNADQDRALQTLIETRGLERYLAKGKGGKKGYESKEPYNVKTLRYQITTQLKANQKDPGPGETPSNIDDFFVLGSQLFKDKYLDEIGFDRTEQEQTVQDASGSGASKHGLRESQTATDDENLAAVFVDKGQKKTATSHQPTEVSSKPPPRIEKRKRGDLEDTYGDDVPGATPSGVTADASAQNGPPAKKPRHIENLDGSDESDLSSHKSQDGLNPGRESRRKRSLDDAMGTQDPNGPPPKKARHVERLDDMDDLGIAGHESRARLGLEQKSRRKRSLDGTMGTDGTPGPLEGPARQTKRIKLLHAPRGDEPRVNANGSGQKQDKQEGPRAATNPTVSTGASRGPGGATSSSKDAEMAGAKKKDASLPVPAPQMSDTPKPEPRKRTVPGMWLWDPIETVPDIDLIRRSMDQIRSDITGFVVCWCKNNGYDHGSAEEAAFLLNLTKELAALYAQLLGTDDWQLKLVQLHERTQPWRSTGYDVSEGLIAAAVYTEVFSKVVPWDLCNLFDEAFAEQKKYFQTAVKNQRYELDDTLKHAAWIQANDRAFQERVMKPHADMLAHKVVRSMIPHLKELKVVTGAQITQQRDWRERIESVFFDGVLLKS